MKDEADEVLFAFFPIISYFAYVGQNYFFSSSLSRWRIFLFLRVDRRQF